MPRTSQPSSHQKEIAFLGIELVEKNAAKRQEETNNLDPEKKQFKTRPNLILPLDSSTMVVTKSVLA